MNENASVYVTRIIDGDTFVGDVPFYVLGHVFLLRDQHFRLDGINAPELKGAEKSRGIEARDYLESLIEGKQIKAEVSGSDKYGRWITTVILGNLNVNDHLILKGLAERREY